MAAWPALLPPLPADVTSQPRENTIRSPWEFGPHQVRSRFTAVPEDVRHGGIKLTGTQVAALETFYVTTLANGTGTFDQPHPRTGVTASWRFVTRPRYSMLAPHGSVSERMWLAEFDLEILP